MPAKVEDDSWAFVTIGTPFPEHPIRVRGEMNQYIALWYKHGKPIVGRAWNNGGVVECSFAYNGKELTGAKDLGGEIQILTNPNAPAPIPSYRMRGFWYEWVPYRDRLQPQYAMVRCGNVGTILMKNGNKNFVANLNLDTDEATYAEFGKEEKKVGGLLDFFILCRNHNKPPGYDPPPPPPTPQAPPPKRKVVLMEGMEDDWVDRRVGDDYPEHAITALGKMLKNEDGTSSWQAVGLWYMAGEPIMGRVSRDAAGKVKAAFGWHGVAYENQKVGSLQVLQYDTEEFEYEYEYKWLPYSEVRPGLQNPEKWRPVHVADASPCVINNNGMERLGMVEMSKERAGVVWGGKEERYQGPVVQSFLVLCRRP